MILLVYASYNLTILALPKNWPSDLALMNIALGTLLNGISASFGKLAANRVKNG